MLLCNDLKESRNKIEQIISYQQKRKKEFIFGQKNASMKIVGGYTKKAFQEKKLI